jgi:lambda repressor-like predicted transcriptional regulator
MPTDQVAEYPPPAQPNPRPKLKSFPKPLDIDWDKAREMRLDGKPWSAIAAALKAKPSSLRKRAERQGWVSKNLSNSTARQIKTKVQTIVQRSVAAARQQVASVADDWVKKQTEDLLRGSQALSSVPYVESDLPPGEALDLLDKRETVRAKHVATGRKLLGLENAGPTTNVQINLGAAGDAVESRMDSAPVIEVDSQVNSEPVK